MKHLIVFLFTNLFIFSLSFGQKLTLTDLTTICSKKNWEDVNQFLLTKKWTYYDSKKGDTYKYNTITWSFNKDYYSEKAQAWFYLYTYEGYPNKISYSVLNKESYSIIQNSIATAGFKLTNSEIEDNEIISTYININYILQVSTRKINEDDTWQNTSLTSYNFTLIKKEGIYDDDNGKKVDYYYGDVVQAEYTLLNGKINGEFKSYYVNGKLKKIGNYLKGKEHGNFVEYNEYGNIEAEYSMVNGMKDGVLKLYKNGKIDVLITFKDDVKNGQEIKYYYNDKTEKLQLKQIGNYLNNQKNGIWKVIIIDDSNNERLVNFDNYTNGLKNGAFQHAEGDSLIIGSYQNDELNGEYRIYCDLKRVLLGGFIQTDTTQLTLFVDGSYFDGVKIGEWKYYDFSKSLREKGNYFEGEKTGEWKYYYSKWTDENGHNKPYSQQLYLIENYSKGKLDGKSTRYSYLKEEPYLCGESNSNANPLDTCYKNVYQKVFEVCFYKNGLLNGVYELKDSLNLIVSKGFFRDDLKEGDWLYRYNQENESKGIYYIYESGNYIRDKREGKWIQYNTEGKNLLSFNYSNGQLDGEYIIWNEFGKYREKKQFRHGSLIELIIYDSLGIKPVRKFEIYNSNLNSYKCRKTEYFDEGYLSQEYFIKKDIDINVYHDWFKVSFLIAIGEMKEVNTNGISSDVLGYKDGIVSLFNNQNQPIIVGQYDKEERFGLWTYYYYDQSVKIEANFKQDKLMNEKYLTLNSNLFSGDFVYYDYESNIKEERKIKDGLRNGKTIYIDITSDKIIKKEVYKNGELK